jgi:hypothetical protein
VTTRTPTRSRLARLAMAGVVVLSFSAVAFLVAHRADAQSGRAKLLDVGVLMPGAIPGPARMRIKMSSDGAGVWVGCSVVSGDGNVDTIPLDRFTDLPLGQVKKIVGDGTAECTLQVGNTPPPWRGVVTLWGAIVDPDACALEQHGGQPCEWCRKDGYHFDRQLDRIEFPLRPAAASSQSPDEWVTVLHRDP